MGNLNVFLGIQIINNEPLICLRSPVLLKYGICPIAKKDNQEHLCCIETNHYLINKNYYYEKNNLFIFRVFIAHVRL